MPVPKNRIIADIMPKEFEVLVKNILSNLGRALKNFKAHHNVKEQSHDGTYQIDIKASFEALGAQFLLLIECKHHKSTIKREVVEVLFSRLLSTGSNKGMIFSTSGFQSGAILFAQKHNIALVRVIERKLIYVTKSNDQKNIDLPEWASMPKFVGEFTEIQNGKKAVSNLIPGHLEPIELFMFGILK